LKITTLAGLLCVMAIVYSATGPALGLENYCEIDLIDDDLVSMYIESVVDNGSFLRTRMDTWFNESNNDGYVSYEEIQAYNIWWSNSESIESHNSFYRDLGYFPLNVNGMDGVIISFEKHAICSPGPANDSSPILVGTAYLMKFDDSIIKGNNTITFNSNSSDSTISFRICMKGWEITGYSGMENVKSIYTSTELTDSQMPGITGNLIAGEYAQIYVENPNYKSNDYTTLLIVFILGVIITASFIIVKKRKR